MGYKRVWRVKVSQNGFDMPLFIEGTEDELRAYLKTELDFVRYYTYTGATEEEVELAHKLHIPLYLASTLPAGKAG